MTIIIIIIGGWDAHIQISLFLSAPVAVIAFACVFVCVLVWLRDRGGQRKRCVSDVTIASRSRVYSLYWQRPLLSLLLSAFVAAPADAADVAVAISTPWLLLFRSTY